MQLTSDRRYPDARLRDSAEFWDMTMDLHKCQRSEFSPKIENVPLSKGQHSSLSYAGVIQD